MTATPTTMTHAPVLVPLPAAVASWLVTLMALGLVAGAAQPKVSLAQVPAKAGANPKAKVVAPPPLPSGKLSAITIWPETFTIRGADRSQQLIVTGRYTNGGLADLTHQAKFLVAQPTVARVEAGGYVVPSANGQTHITVDVAGLKAKATVHVESVDRDLPINFGNEIVPLFSKLGCNGGGCHGKISGQNGFRLSLLGFEPELDYETLTREGRGRRLFPAAPQRSLLLTKATGTVPHGGGKRLEPDSPEYQLIARWIRSGVPFGEASDPKVVAISMEPTHRIIALKSRQQITVTAHYSDGTSIDVTHRAEYISNDNDIAAVDEHGVVSTLEIPGEAAIMARFLGHVAVFRAGVPLSDGVDRRAWPKPTNFVDTHVFAKLEQLGVPPSSLCSDEEFLRRASLDLTSTLPTPQRVREFLADKRPDKRARLIDELLERPEYAATFAVKWGDILRNKTGSRNGRGGASTATVAFHNWLRQALSNNMPYDQLVRAVITAQGDPRDNPPVAWYRDLTTPEALVDDTAQAFLGTRIQCARCHHHPYERWSQDDYWGLVSFYARVGRKPSPLSRNAQTPERLVFVQRAGLARNPANNKTMPPRGLDAEPLTVAPDEDPRDRLVDWMADPANPFFAPALVNRYWAHFFSRGIVDPPDDMRVSNPPTNPELLDALAAHFVASKFDLKAMIRTICNSTTYQLSALPNERNRSDKQNFARYMPKRLAAEVLLDAINTALNTETKFGNLPDGARAIELPDEADGNYFLTVFGKPKRDSACECERTGDANLAQSLHLLNSSEIQSKLTDGASRPATLARDTQRSDADKIEDVWLAVLGRLPTPSEQATAVDYITSKTSDPKTAATNRRQAYEDLFWTLINTKEFLFNH